MTNRPIYYIYADYVAKQHGMILVWVKPKPHNRLGNCNRKFERNEKDVIAFKVFTLYTKYIYIVQSGSYLKNVSVFNLETFL